MGEKLPKAKKAFKGWNQESYRNTSKIKLDLTFTTAGESIPSSFFNKAKQENTYAGAWKKLKSTKTPLSLKNTELGTINKKQ